MKILFIEDDIEYGKIFKTLLESEKFTVDFFDNAYEGIEAANNNEYDLVISDVELGVISGFHVIELISKKSEKTKFILLTGSDLENYELQGLRLGVDEFLRKTTTFAIMLERIKKVLANDNKKIKILEDKYENIKINLSAYQVFKDGVEISLTHLEYNLLVYLMKNQDHVMTRENIVRDVWSQEGDSVDLRTVDTFIKTLRQKMNIHSIFTVRGVGYKWNGKK